MTEPATLLSPDKRDGYVVVARRYRPQAFAQVVGQDQVVRALSNAIQSNRVAHAYLFTGARGVGKTSTARILSKCLNCQEGTSITPCNECDACQAISVGADVDVLEIDGASNRGIDEIRELRQNAGVRPSRSPYKIYIIDEVHMLTKEAFNALLKTLEEPPEHVKFIFCTTEAEKIPITILSRCQRFDFASIRPESIGERLQQIVKSEGCEIEPAAVAALARRAAGSMRDSQSLLDQLLAFGGKKITAADVHSMLGTANDERVGKLVSGIIERRPADVLGELDGAVNEGVDVGQVLDQLLGYFRDVMVLAAGGSTEQLLFTSPSEQERVRTASQQMGLETVLAAMQIFDETKSRLRFSTQGRVLAELALVRACQLENLEELPKLIALLKGAGSAPGEAQKKNELSPAPVRSAPAETPREAHPALVAAPAARVEPPAAPPAAAAAPPRAPAPPARTAPEPEPGEFTYDSSELARALESAPTTRSTPPTPSGPSSESLSADPAGATALTPESAPELWRQVIAQLGDMIAEHAASYDRLAIPAPNRLVVTFKGHYNFHKNYCERRTAQFEQTLSGLTGSHVRIEFTTIEDDSKAPAAAPVPVPAPVVPAPSRALGRQSELLENPFVKRASELFAGKWIKHEDPAPPQQ